MKIALVDDEQGCLDEMAELVREFGIQYRCQVNTVPFLNVEASLDAFEDSGFSAVFMDIYMDGMDSVAAALKMRGLDSRCVLVFLTSSMDFMPDAFSCHAFEYISKPFSPQRIFQVPADILEVLPPREKYIEAVSGRKTVRVFLDDIVSAITDTHYLDIGLLDGVNLRCRMTMAEFVVLTGGDPRFLPVNKVSSLAEKGDIGSIQAYLAKYEASLAKDTPPNHCANAALNALFGHYHGMAVSAGIDTDWRIELPEPLPAAELDMASLFGNLLENAIEGCLTVPEGGRYFCLTTETRHRNGLYIVSTNSFDGKVRKGKDGYRSTKHDGNGIGLVAIAAAAEKYGGSAQASNSCSEFFVDVALKI